MLTNSARWLVASLLSLVAVFAFYMQVYEIGALALTLAGLVMWGYFKEGTVILAAKLYKRKQYEKAREVLLSINRPDWLSKKRKPYYEYLRGVIAVHQMQYEEAEVHLSRAAHMGLKVSELGSVLMHLANICLRHKDKRTGLSWIAEAKKLPLPARQQAVLQNLERELHKV